MRKIKVGLMQSNPTFVYLIRKILQLDGAKTQNGARSWLLRPGVARGVYQVEAPVEAKYKGSQVANTVFCKVECRVCPHMRQLKKTT